MNAVRKDTAPLATPLISQRLLEVAQFEQACLRELFANRLKGDWRTAERTPRQHRNDLDYHVAKLKIAQKQGDPVRVLEYAADVANHALLITRAAGCDRATLAARRDEHDFVSPGRRLYARLALNPRWAWKGLRGWRKAGELAAKDEPDWYY